MVSWGGARISLSRGSVLSREYFPSSLGVLQGSVLGPILFLLYVADLLQLVKRHGLHPHCHADDTQIYGFCDPSDVDALQECLSVCIDEVFSWKMSTRLQLQEWGAMVFICLTSASDPYWSCACWWHICAASMNSLRPGGLHWHRCHHECSRHCSRQSVFCSTPSNMQCASFADTSACTCSDNGGLLQLSSLGYFQTAVTTAAVCLQCRHSSRVLRKEVGAHNSTSPWTTLAESSGENSVLVMRSRLSLPYRHGSVTPCWDPPLDCRHKFTSASFRVFLHRH